MKKPAKEEFTPAELNKVFSTWKAATIRIKYPENETVESAALVFATHRGIGWARTNYGQPSPNGEPNPWYRDSDGLFEADGAGFVFRDRVGAIYHLREFADRDGSELAAEVARFERWLEGEGLSWPDAWQRVHQYLLDVAALRIEEVPPEYVSYRKERDAFASRVSEDLPKVLSRVGRLRLADAAFAISRSERSVPGAATARKKKAREIQMTAIKLRKQTDAFFDQLGGSRIMSRDVRDLGVDSLERQFGASASSAEMSAARLGLDRNLYGWVLRGIEASFEAYSLRHPVVMGAGKKWRERYLAEKAWNEFRADGLSVGKEATDLQEACRKLYLAAGLTDQADQADKRADTAKNFIAKFNKQKK